MKIKRWSEFNESLSSEFEQNDLDKVLNYIALNIPSSEIPKLKNELLPLEESVVNEGIFSNLRDRLSKWFDEKIMNYVVNKKKEFYVDLIGKLDLFDLTNLQDIKDNFRGFKLDSIYLAGGMDKAKDVGAGWRAQVEYEFEVANGGIKSDMEEISIPYYGKNIKVVPAYVIDGEHINDFIKVGNGYARENYDLPAILNPVRKEVDRTKNPEFGEEMRKFKTGEMEDTTDPREFDKIDKIFSGTIEPEDELIVNLVDAVFVGFNEATSGGTFGELQQTSFLKKPMFAWYIDGWKISGHSPWNLPHVSKIMRTDEDMKTFVKTMINYNK
jgi:hypothetical protein